MIVFPAEAKRRPYNSVEYKSLTKKFCNICKTDLYDYVAYLEFCLKTYYHSADVLDKNTIMDIKQKIGDNCNNSDEVEIFINSIFLEIVAPFHYSKVKDLIDFLEDFPYKKCPI